VATGVGSITVEGSQGEGRNEPARAVYLVRLTNGGQPLVPSERYALRGVDVVHFGRGPLGTERSREGSDTVLRVTEPDVRISTSHARLHRVLGRWVLEDRASKNGTWVGGARVQSVALRDDDLIELGRTFYLFRDGVAGEPDEALDLRADGKSIAGMATLNVALQRDLRALAAVARSNVSIVIQAETGTGKELVARAVHTMSGRSGAFVAVNCGSIPDALVASELFGARRGAYSDAKEDRPGIIRSAHKGTLFLDEIGDLKLELQPAFLRVLQEREVVPLGQAGAIPVDVRVISATHRQLDKLVAAGSFREDLWARLAGFATFLPPLRARREDLGILVATMVRRYAPAPEQVTFHPDALRALFLCVWPRNIRELEKRIEAALALAGNGDIERRHLGDLVAPTPAPAPALTSADDVRRVELERLLDEHRGNLAAVARALGRDRVQVRRWLARYGLNAATFKH
jgi:transcriptional regulator with GAF, ATPase, and Fis domain